MTTTAPPVPTGTATSHPYPPYTPVRIDPAARPFGVPVLAFDELTGTVVETGTMRGERWYHIATDAGTDVAVSAKYVFSAERVPGSGNAAPTASYTVEARLGAVGEHPVTGAPVYGWWPMIQAELPLLRGTVAELDQVVAHLVEEWRDDEDPIRVTVTTTGPGGQPLVAYEVAEPRREPTVRR
jgi:hypothetical protein